MPDITQIIPPRVPLVDARTGMISREWYRFFFNQFEKTSGNFSNLAPFDISLTGSPFTYQNTNSYMIDVLVGGTVGGVTNLEFSRNGITWYKTGSFYGMFTLSSSDYLRITYTTAPTVTGISR
jgi:hypothetical protein